MLHHSYQYCDLIKNGLPIDRWLRNTEKGYLPDFLDTKEQRFGHARIGNYEQVMIYQYTGTDEARNNNYRNAYVNSDAHIVFGKITDIESDYNKYIQGMLKRIVTANNLNDVYAVENSDEYKKFACKQILRKITILMSLDPSSLYKNEFMWVFNENSLKELAKIFEIDIDEHKSFLENNKAVYDIAKKYAGITATSRKSDFIKLYDFLRFLSNNENTSEFSDFSNINIIFNGAPGTGKTYGVITGIEKLQRIDSSQYRNSRYIQFHPAFTYQDFIEGIKPLGIVAGNLNLQVVNGSFKDFCIFVKKENEKYYKTLSKQPDPKNPSDFSSWPHYYFIVDEINRGNLSNIFGETFTLLEPDYRDYDFSGNYSKKTANLLTTPLSNVISKLEDKNYADSLIYKKIGDDICFGIPFNIHFIGMMNDVDKSIDAFDLALRRRFKWIPKYCDYDVIQDVLTSDGYGIDNVDEYVESCKNLNNFICDVAGNGLKLGRTYEFGHAFFLKIRCLPGNKKVTKAKKAEIFTNYIEGTLKEYIRQVADESEIDNWIAKASAAFGI